MHRQKKDPQQPAANLPPEFTRDPGLRLKLLVQQILSPVVVTGSNLSSLVRLNPPWILPRDDFVVSHLIEPQIPARSICRNQPEIERVQIGRQFRSPNSGASKVIAIEQHKVDALHISGRQEITGTKA